MDARRSLSLCDISSDIWSHICEYIPCMAHLKNMAIALASAHARSAPRPLWQQLLHMIQFTLQFRVFHQRHQYDIVDLLNYIHHFAAKDHGTLPLHVRRIHLVIDALLLNRVSSRVLQIFSHLPCLQYLHMPVVMGNAPLLQESPPLQFNTLQSLNIYGLGPHIGMISFPQLTTLHIHEFYQCTEANVMLFLTTLPSSLTSLTIESFQALTDTTESITNLPNLRHFRLPNIVFREFTLDADQQIHCMMRVFAVFWHQLETLSFIPSTHRWLHRLTLPLPASLHVLEVTIYFGMHDQPVYGIRYDVSHIPDVSHIRIHLVKIAPWTKSDLWELHSLIQDDHVYPLHEMPSVAARHQIHKDILRHLLFLMEHFEEYDAMSFQLSHHLESADTPMSSLPTLHVPIKSVLQGMIHDCQNRDPHTALKCLRQFLNNICAELPVGTQSLSANALNINSPFLSVCILLIREVNIISGTRDSLHRLCHLFDTPIPETQLEFVLRMPIW